MPLTVGIAMTRRCNLHCTGMKLALIYPPFFHKKFNENLPTVDDEFGLFPHIGFGWVAAAVKQAGHEVKLFDAAVSKCDYETMLREVREYNPDVLGFAAHAIQTFRDMLLWAGKFKRDIGLPTLVGGYEAKIYPHEIMEHECFDYLCAGEAMTFMGPFMDALRRGHGFNKVPDVYSGEVRSVKKTHDAPHMPFRDHLHPDRSIFPNEHYYSHVSSRSNFTIGMSEVGCPYPCSFCAMRQTGFDARTPSQVADEMQECVELYNIHEIDWFDPVMLHDRQRMLDLAEELKLRKLDMIWSARARIDSLSLKRSNGKVDDHLIKSLAESGCKRLFFGVESGDNMILKNIKKCLQTDNMKKVLDAVVAHGIRPLGFFMIGNPGETKETVYKSIKLLKHLPLDYAQFTITIMKPHSELEKDNVVAAEGLSYWREYIRGTVEEQVLPTPWTKLSRAELEALTRKAYLHFYMRPKYIFKMIARLESPRELLRYVRVFFQLLLRPVRPQLGKKMSLFRKIGRCSLAFIEGVIASINQGARHPVAAYGGGLRGALVLARHEWKRSTTLQDLPSPGNADEMLLRNDSKKEMPKNKNSNVPSRYIPLSSGALGADRKMNVYAPADDNPDMEEITAV